MVDTGDFCSACRTPIPEGTATCPGCGAALVFCDANDECFKPYPGILPACPFCQTPNPRAAQFAPPPPPVDVAPPPVAEKTAPPVDLAALFAAAPPSAPAPAAPPAAPGPPPPANFAALLAQGAASASPAAPAPARRAAALAPPLRAPTPFPAEFTAPPPGRGAGFPSGAVAPIHLDYKVPPPAPRRGQQSLLRLRIAALAVVGEADVELAVESRLWPAPPALKRIIQQGESLELPSLQFVPQIVGGETLRLVVTVREPDGLPLGRWSAHVDMAIADASRETTGGTMRIGKDGDIVMTGLPNLLAPAIPGLGGAPPTDWHPVALQPDAVFRRWLEAVCPAPRRPAPNLPRAVLSGGATGLGLLRLTDPRRKQTRTVVVTRGASARLGRGSDGVEWWVEPDPYNETEHRRLSRCHAALELRDGRAWLTNQSANGTWVVQPNLRPRTPLAKDQRELLAHGDLFEPAGLAPLRVGLATSRGPTGDSREGRVHAVWLERTDAAGARLAYLLTAGTDAVPLGWTADGEPVAWVAWRGDGAASELVFLPAGATGWLKAPSGRDVTLGPLRLHWAPLAGPVDQSSCLSQ